MDFLDTLNEFSYRFPATFSKECLRGVTSSCFAVFGGFFFFAVVADMDFRSTSFQRSSAAASLAGRDGRDRARAVRRPAGADPGDAGGTETVTAETSESVGWQNFGKMLLVFGCISSDFCKKICVLQHFSKSTRFSS